MKINNPTIHHMPQGSDEWYEIRKGRMTASNASTIAVNGKGLETYAYKVVASIYEQEDSYTNEAMERGKELEDQARELYELSTGNEVTQVGFITLTDYAGCSPDGLIIDGDEIMSGIEIKCHSMPVYRKLIDTGKIDPSYIAQIQMNMMITGAETWDYVAYCPSSPKTLWIKTIEADPTYHQKLLAGLEAGRLHIDRLHGILKKYKKGLQNNCRYSTIKMSKLNLNPTDMKTIQDLAVMDWYDPTAPLAEQLSALNLELLEEAIDLHYEKRNEYENDHLCPGCGAGMVAVFNPASGDNCPIDQPSMIEEFDCSSSCPL